MKNASADRFPLFFRKERKKNGFFKGNLWASAVRRFQGAEEEKIIDCGDGAATMTRRQKIWSAAPAAAEPAGGFFIF